MKDYSSEELKKMVQENSEKKKRILLRWAEEKLPLMFYIKDGRDIRGQLLFFTRYDYIVQMEGNQTASIIAKHAVNVISRAK